MRYLWLAFLIGWSGSTYAAVGTSPSVDVPIIISPSGPTPPAGAVAAGFTTLAANYDFTQTLPSNWLDCYPGDGGTHLLYQGLWWYDSSPPCSQITQGKDPTTGQLAVHLVFTPADGNTFTDRGMHQTLSSLSHANHAQVVDFGNAYYETIARFPPITNGYGAWWTWGTAAARGGPGPIEWDAFEAYGTNFAGYDAAIHNWGNTTGDSYIWQGVSGHLPANYDPSQYHKYAVRLTSDGSTLMSACSYVDDTLIACSNPQAVGVEFNQRNFLIFNLGGPFSGTRTSVNEDAWIKSMNIWSCANWQTSMCNGTVLTGAP